MLYELAVLPDVFEHETKQLDSLILFELFLSQLAKNCVLANLDKGRWLKYIKSLDMTPSARDRFLRYIIRLDKLHRIIDCPPTFDVIRTNKDWLDLALSANAVRPFDGIVAKENLWNLLQKRPTNYISYPPSLDDGNVWYEITEMRSMRIVKDRDNFAKFLSPLLRYARSVWLIDPFLNCHEESFLATIHMIANFLGSFRDGRYGDYIEIQTSVYKLQKIAKRQKRTFSLEFEKNAWAKVLKPLAQDHGIEFCVKFIGKNKKLLDPHNRYLLTDQCGAIVPWGFDCYGTSKAGDDVWSLMDERTWNDLREEFIFRPEHKVIDLVFVR